MKQIEKYWRIIKQKSPTILAVAGSIGTGITAYLAASNEAKYQHSRFDYYIENGYFPEELCDKDLSKDEIRKNAYKILGDHLKYHITTFISGGLTVTSILGGCAVGKKQNAALVAMNVGIGNMIAQRKGAEDHLIEAQPKEKKKPVSREELQDYLIMEAYNNDLVYYTNLESRGDDEEFIWLDCYPGNKIFIVKRNDVNGLESFVNNALVDVGHISYGEIFDFINIYGRLPKDFDDPDINDWIYMYGFSKEPDDMSRVEVFSRPVQMEDGTVITALSFSAAGNVIQL